MDREKRETQGGSAFPTMGYGMGMTLKDYFAAHAPEAPDWFEHQEPPRDYPGEPSVDALPEEFREEAKAWLHDPCWDLDGSAVEKGIPLEAVYKFIDDANAHWDGKAAWKNRNRIARMTQWAYAWADAMLKARGG